MDFKGRSFLKLLDFTSEESACLIDIAAELKYKKKAGIPHRLCEGKNIALLFEKTITREFEVYYTEDVKSGKSKQNKVLTETVEMIKEYKLEATDKGSLRKLRKSNEPLFIFKDGENYYYTKIPYDMSFLKALNIEHKCARHNGVCRRMCPAADECGGCAKVRDLYAHPV